MFFQDPFQSPAPELITLGFLKSVKTVLWFCSVVGVCILGLLPFTIIWPLKTLSTSYSRGCLWQGMKVQFWKRFSNIACACYCNQSKSFLSVVNPMKLNASPIRKAIFMPDSVTNVLLFCPQLTLPVKSTRVGHNLHQPIMSLQSNSKSVSHLCCWQLSVHISYLL